MWLHGGDLVRYSSGSILGPSPPKKIMLVISGVYISSAGYRVVDVIDQSNGQKKQVCLVDLEKLQ